MERSQLLADHSMLHFASSASIDCDCGGGQVDLEAELGPEERQEQVALPVLQEGAVHAAPPLQHGQTAPRGRPRVNHLTKHALPRHESHQNFALLLPALAELEAFAGVFGSQHRTDFCILVN